MTASLRRRALLGASLAPLALPGLAQAQGAWPSRPVTLIVPFAAGGITDTGARVIAQAIGRILGQPMVVENRAGAGGTIGTELVVRAAPDGYTVLYGTQGPIAAAPNLFANLRYDPLRDLMPVHGAGASPNAICSAPSKPWRTLQEFVAAARAQPDRITYGSSGVGTSLHLGAEMLSQIMGVRMIHTPYTNATQAMADLIAGRIDVMWDFPLTAAPHVREGRLRALAVTDHARVALLPDVPTTAEAGLPGVEMLAWAGFFVPRGTSAAPIARLAAAAGEALRDPKVVEFFDGSGIPLWPDKDTARFTAFLVEELPRIAALIRRSGAKPE
ncbi:MAG: tripartite tricarboxylate transporter substrate binding protein [Acetobacteraceae bacterium]|nr:tripartite tricarboxylate transporter substrate binding protein [Acetobacteraceae bacterium]